MQLSSILHSPTRLIFSLLILLFAVPAFSQAPPLPQSVFDYLSPQEGVAMTIELDLTELINNKNTNQFFPATITTADGNLLQVDIRARGKYRRKMCDVPPLKLKFSKKVLRAAQLDTLNEVKLVVPCFHDAESESLLLREYVAYRLFEQLSPAHAVRARLVKITFRDRHVEQIKEPVYCLLLEHEEQVAARLRGTMVEDYNLSPEQLDGEQSALTSLFEYMIGNTDWAVDNFRNVYLLKPNNGDKIRVIPYDFDFSGLVGASYAKANQATKPERKLVTKGLSAQVLKQAAATIQAAKPDLITWCNAPFLSKNTSKELHRYLESFYQALDTKLDFSEGKVGDIR